MLTNQTYINYAQQIAEVFCTEARLKALCEANVKTRIVANFNDDIFANSFLPGLDVSKFKSVTLSSVKPDRNGKKYFKFNGFDIVTNQAFEVEIGNVPTGLPYSAIFAHLNSWFISQGTGIRCAYLGSIENNIIVKWTSEDTYGIVFVPGSTGGGGCPGGYEWNEVLARCLPVGTGGSGGGGGGGGSIIIPPENPEPLEVPEMIAGFDLESYLIPGLAVGAALLIYYNWK